MTVNKKSRAKMLNIQIVVVLLLQFGSRLIQSAPQSKNLTHTWPYLPTYDIWGTGEITKKTNDSKLIQNYLTKSAVIPKRPHENSKEIKANLKNDKDKFKEISNYSNKNDTITRNGKGESTLARK